MNDLLHVAIGAGGCLLCVATVLTSVQVSRVPVPPVMFGVRFLVLTVVFLRIAQELCKG
jgi:hypothetical protein